MSQTFSEEAKKVPQRGEIGEAPVKGEDEWFHKFTSASKAEALNEKRLIQVDIELTSNCFGSCVYCFSSSEGHREITIPKERAFALVDEAKELGIRQIHWIGGEPLLHPHWYDIVKYTLDSGLRAAIISTGDLYTKENVKKIMGLEVYKRGWVAFHLETLNQEVFNKLHKNPAGLKARIKGMHTLLEGGYPNTQVYPQMVLTRPMISTIEELIDWYVDEIGVKYIAMNRFMPKGFGVIYRHFAPTLEEVRRAFEYRAKKLGSEMWLKMGPTECSKYYCKTTFYIQCDGQVLPCTYMPQLAVGNIFQRGLVDIVRQHNDILVHDYETKGYCATECENRDYCWGCRASAFNYLGDKTLSDPFCWQNPTAPKHVLEI
jgi:MoaA/NifB/PqqE/SkfB family radical SAM enzyme